MKMRRSPGVENEDGDEDEEGVMWRLGIKGGLDVKPKDE